MNTHVLNLLARLFGDVDRVLFVVVELHLDPFIFGEETDGIEVYKVVAVQGLEHDLVPGFGGNESLLVRALWFARLAVQGMVGTDHIGALVKSAHCHSPSWSLYGVTMYSDPSSMCISNVTCSHLSVTSLAFVAAVFAFSAAVFAELAALVASSLAEVACVYAFCAFFALSVDCSISSFSCETNLL